MGWGASRWFRCASWAAVDPATTPTPSRDQLDRQQPPLLHAGGTQHQSREFRTSPSTELATAAVNDNITVTIASGNSGQNACNSRPLERPAPSPWNWALSR